MEFEPQAFAAGLALLPAVFGELDALTVRRVVDRGQFGESPEERVAGRITRWLWVPATLVCCAVMGLLALFRRGEFAVYRAFHLPVSGVLFMAQVELAVLTTCVVSIAIVWSVVIHAIWLGPLDVAHVGSAIAIAVTFGIAVIIAGPLVTLVLGAGSPAQLLKER